MTPQQKKFKTAVHVCWADMRAGHRNVSPGSLGSCMKSKLKGHRAKHSRKGRKGRRKSRR